MLGNAENDDIKSEQGLEDPLTARIKQEHSSLSEDSYLCEDENVSNSSPPLLEEEDDERLFNEENLILCALCSRNFEDLSSYDSHFGECRYVRSEPKVGENQLRTRKPAAGPKPIALTITKTEHGRYQCSVCSKEYLSRGACRKHCRTTHKTRTCPFCKKIFPHSDLHRHKEKHCEGSQPACDQCGNTFKNRDGLRTHVFYYHNSFRYKCEQCGRAFMRGTHLRKHVDREHGEAG